MNLFFRKCTFPTFFFLFQGMQSQFKKVSQSDVDSKGSPYDYASVMHYPKWAFQKARGLDTIRPKKAGVVSIYPLMLYEFY